MNHNNALVNQVLWSADIARIRTADQPQNNSLTCWASRLHDLPATILVLTDVSCLSLVVEFNQTVWTLHLRAVNTQGTEDSIANPYRIRTSIATWCHTRRK